MLQGCRDEDGTWGAAAQHGSRSHKLARLSCQAPLQQLNKQDADIRGYYSGPFKLSHSELCPVPRYAKRLLGMVEPPGGMRLGS